MKVAVIHGQAHRGSTWNCVQIFLQEIIKPGDEIQEFYVNQMDFCIGCFQCFSEGEECCPHFAKVAPLAQAIDEADLIVMASPTYVMGMSGQLKAFLDHLGYQWMVHRPRVSMQDKVGVAISTTAGLGAKGVTKSLRNHYFHWGIPRSYGLGFAVAADSWENVAEKKKERIIHQLKKTARKAAASTGKKQFHPFLFLYRKVISAMHKNSAGYERDRDYWIEQGWI